MQWSVAKEVIVIFTIDDEKPAKPISNYGQKIGKIKHTEELLVDELNERKEKVKKTTLVDPSLKISRRLSRSTKTIPLALIARKN